MFGVPVYVDISFAILMLLFTTSHGSLVYGVSFALLLAISVVLHEFAHALTARAFGYETRDITISLLGGCAALCGMPRKAYQEFLTAAAGPAASFAISGAVLALDSYGLLPGRNEYAVSCWNYLFYLNLMLGAFNLLPGFPMDGGRIFRSFMRLFLSRPKATLVAMWVGRAFAILLGFSGLHAVLTGGGWGFIRIFIAWMIWQEGMREYRQALVEDRFDRGWTQADFDARVSPPPYERD